MPLAEQTAMVYWHGDELWADHLWARISAAHSVVTLTRDTALDAAWSLAMTEAHRAAGWLPLHAAVIVRGERAVAITGVSGAGKSTATLRLLNLGYSVLGEDRAFWRAATGEIWGLDRFLRTFDDSLDRWAPQWRPDSPQRDIKGKVMLPLPLRPPAQLVAVLVLGDARPLSTAERVRLTWEMTGLPLTQPARAEVQRNVPRLLPLLQPQAVNREQVIQAVQALLDK